MAARRNPVSKLEIHLNEIRNREKTEAIREPDSHGLKHCGNDTRELHAYKAKQRKKWEQFFVSRRGSVKLVQR